MYHKDLVHARQAACVGFNLRCIYSVCVAVKAGVLLLLMISSAFLSSSLLILPSCTCLHFAPKLTPPAVMRAVNRAHTRFYIMSFIFPCHKYGNFFIYLFCHNNLFKFLLNNILLWCLTCNRPCL